MRNRVSADRLIWDTDMARAMQLMHVDGIRNGNRYQWAVFFEPEQDLIDEFDRLSNSELDEL